MHYPRHMNNTADRSRGDLVLTVGIYEISVMRIEHGTRNSLRHKTIPDSFRYTSPLVGQS